MLNRLKKLLPGNSNTSSAETTAPENRTPAGTSAGRFLYARDCRGVDVHTTQETVPEAVMGKQQYAI
ncbi:helicase/Zfx / Zfy transcription activation region domain protein [Shigella boydii 4444-74]|uniref:Helicase/Zfx / Zfy transcription activation region domain protein n=1 Tax=Shigella boydii 4444-74 TaxID=766140 RepID=I6F1Q3_SHIBO|nr:helicase/Zfx / Zfy transcription activation region domain protein [Shigella boydii 4444-74]